MSNAVQSMICFMPRVSLYDDLCPMFVAVQEPEIQLASDCRQAPPHQLGAWSSEVFLILGYVLLQALAIHSTFFHVDSLLLTEDMSCQKLPIPCGNQSQQSYLGGFCKNGTEWFTP